MKLISFEEPHYHNERLGLMIGEETVVDANYAYGRMLSEQGDDYPQKFADAVIPPKMVSFLQGGKRSMQAAREVEKFVKGMGQKGSLARGESRAPSRLPRSSSKRLSHDRGR